METVDIAQLAIWCVGFPAVIVVGSIWLDKASGRKVDPREHFWLATSMLALSIVLVGCSVYAVRVPQSFLGWLYASAGVGGVLKLFDFGLTLAFIIILGRNIWKRSK